MIALTVLLSLLAWAMLAMAMPKHGQAILKRPIGKTTLRALRWSGFSLLLLGFAVVVAGAGWEFGAVYWLGIIMLSAIAWVLLLTLATPAPAKTRKTHGVP